MLQAQVIEDMKKCLQTETQSVYQHGESVRDYTFKLIDMLRSGETSDCWRLPPWFMEYRKQILKSLLPENIIGEYTTYHDCGKPYCLSFDENGKRHFPNHAEVSAQTWIDVGGNEQIGKLISMDMMVHTMKAVDVEEFCSHPEAITLLIVALAEVHSNASMFGGIESQSFKIKFSQINKRGKAICHKLFGANMSQVKSGDKLYVITRRDLEPGYQAVQSMHALRQFTAEHPERDREWFDNSNYLGLLSVTDEPALNVIIEQAVNQNIRLSVFREPDIDNQITAIALEPGPKSKKICSKLKLALKD